MRQLFCRLLLTIFAFYSDGAARDMQDYRTGREGTRTGGGSQYDVCDRAAGWVGKQPTSLSLTVSSSQDTTLGVPADFDAVLDAFIDVQLEIWIPRFDEKAQTGEYTSRSDRGRYGRRRAIL